MGFQKPWFVRSFLFIWSFGALIKSSRWRRDFAKKSRRVAAAGSFVPAAGSFGDFSLPGMPAGVSMGDPPIQCGLWIWCRL